MIFTGAAAATATVVLLPTASALASPGSVMVGVGQRVVLSLAWGYNAITSYTVRVRIKNSNLFAASGPAVGWLSPGLGNIGQTVDANLNVAIPVLSVGQNDPVNPGLQVVDHVYLPADTPRTDYLYLPGNLAGSLDILLTTAGPAPAAGDYFKVACDIY